MESLYNHNYDYDYTRPRVVVFPAPPPTTNALGPSERARLLRSSKKIARVLGTTPRFIDFQIENVRGNDDTLVPTPQSIYRTSVDSLDSVSSCSTSFTSTSYDSTSTSVTSVSSSHSLDRTRKSWPLTPLQDAWPTRESLKMKLALKTSLESIPASPLTPTFTSPSVLPSKSISMSTRHKRSAPFDGSPTSSPCRSLSPEPIRPSSSPPSPSFVIATRVATRRRKLDRLRRILGEDVPVRLVFPQAAEDDSESGSESSVSSCEKTREEDNLIALGISPLSPASSLVNVDVSNSEDKPISHPCRTDSRKKKITNTRDSLTLSSKSLRSTKMIKVPLATRAAPPPPTLSTSPTKNVRSKATIQSKPQASFKARGPVPSPPWVYEHPPIVHRRSHSGSSTSTSLGLGVILEEKGESEWYESDDEDIDFDFIGEDEALDEVYGRGSGSSFLFGGPVGKDMGRGLAKSYGYGGY